MAPPRKPQVGRWGAYSRAQDAYRVLGDCEGCGLVAAEVRHHRDGNVHDNARSNVTFLCRACHARLHHVSETCRRGHPWTPENTYTPPNGKRQCRACRRLRDRSVTGP